MLCDVCRQTMQLWGGATAEEKQAGTYTLNYWCPNCGAAAHVQVLRPASGDLGVAQRIRDELRVMKTSLPPNALRHSDDEMMARYNLVVNTLERLLQEGDRP